VIFGEISTGKSALINALVGRDVASVDVRGGWTREIWHVAWDGTGYTLPGLGESQVVLVDTPGINEVGGGTRGEMAREAAQRSDLVLFVTDSDLNETEHTALVELAAFHKPLIVVLDEVEDPHNVGAIVRTVDAAGAHGVVRQTRRAAAIDGVAAKASAGAVSHVPIVDVVNISRALTERFCTLRVMGSGTLTLLGPAAGRGSAAVVHRFSPIDHLAAVLIAHEAGAEVWDEAGRPSLFPAYGGVMVAAPGVADELFGAWHMALGRDRA
jgi:hypothetical protein